MVPGTGGNIRNVWRNHHIGMAVVFPSSTWACASGSAAHKEAGDDCFRDEER